MRSPQALIGLDVGGTNIKAMAFTPDGQKLAEDLAPTGDDGTTAWRDNARDVFRKILTRCPADYRVGVAAPGLAAADGSSIISMPGKLSGVEGLVWQEWLGLSEPVPVLNDAKAALLGERWLGAARGSDNVLLLTLGTGVGGAMIVDGHLLHGYSGRAGHLGHVSLDPDGPPDLVKTPGSLEDAIGEHSVRQRSKGRFASTRDLVMAFRSGSAEAAEVWLKSVKALAAALVGFMNSFDPEIIVLGGGIADADDSLFEPLQKFLDAMEWHPQGAKVRIVKAALGGTAGAAGAAYAAKLAAASGSNQLHLGRC